MSALMYGAVAAAPDSVDIDRSGDDLLVNIHRSRGIGAIVIPAIDVASCRRVVVRLHDFTQLESLVAMSNTGLLECELQRREGKPPAQTCRLNDAPIGALSREANYFEITLPPVFANGNAIQIQWVDQWR